MDEEEVWNIRIHARHDTRAFIVFFSTTVQGDTYGGAKRLAQPRFDTQMHQRINSSTYVNLRCTHIGVLSLCRVSTRRSLSSSSTVTFSGGCTKVTFWREI